MTDRTRPMITPEVITLEDAIKHLQKVQDREVYLNTSVYETQYAIVLVLMNLSNVNK